MSCKHAQTFQIKPHSLLDMLRIKCDFLQTVQFIDLGPEKTAWPTYSSFTPSLNQVLHTWTNIRCTLVPPMVEEMIASLRQSSQSAIKWEIIFEYVMDNERELQKCVWTRVKENLPSSVTVKSVRFNYFWWHQMWVFVTKGKMWSHVIHDTLPHLTPTNKTK